jgi:glucose/arabinose dehydrogenase
MLRELSLVLVTLLSISANAAEPNVTLQPLVSGLVRPVQVVAAHDGSRSLYVAHQGGQILRLDPRDRTTHPYLDLSPIVSCCANGGLLSLVFHPAYAANGRLYVLYVNVDGNTVIARYLRSAANPEVADPQSVEILLVAEQPKDNVPNHHGGTLLFGPDGLLYASIGDGGAYVKVTNRAQERNHLLGKLLRLDVDHASPYTIPADNPFAGSSATRGEIFALGLRNPWRLSFDRTTGKLFIADVGQDSWEEIDVVTLSEARGANFGWPLLEGSHCYPPGITACDTSSFLMPKIEYPSSLGCSVTGGFRYRGSLWPALWGVYLYGDFCSGRLWAATERADGSWTTRELLKTTANIVSFGEDDEGELYLVDYNGTISRIAGTVPARRRTSSH